MRSHFWSTLVVVFLTLCTIQADGAGLSVQNASGSCGSTLKVPIRVDVAGVTGFDFTVNYDRLSLKVKAIVPSSSTSRFSFVPDDSVPGKLVVTVRGPEPLPAADRIADIEFDVLPDSVAGSTPISISNVSLATPTGTIPGTGGSANIPISCGSAVFTVGNANAICGESVTFPVSIQTSNPAYSVSFRLEYDSYALRSPSVTKGPLAAGFDLMTRLLADGELEVSLSGPTPISGEGVIATVRFEVLPSAINAPTKIGIADPKTGAVVNRGFAGIVTLGCPGRSCPPETSTLCLQDRRFSVDLTAKDPRSGRTAIGVPVPKNKQTGFFSLVDLTGDLDNPEVFVKILKPFVGGYWVFYGGLTDFEYTLTVTDTRTSKSKVFRKPAYQFCGGNDTSTFDQQLIEGGGDEQVAGGTGEVGLADGTDLYLAGRRFRVTLDARDQRTGDVSRGAVFDRNEKFGYFFLPNLTKDPTNPEVFIKIVPFPPDSYWLFHGGLTDLEYSFLVTDLVNGTTRSYKKEAGVTCGEIDLSTFRRGETRVGCPREVLEAKPFSSVQAREVIAGDFDNDLDIDLVVSNFTTRRFSLHRGDGTGAFGPAESFLASAASNATVIDVATADFNQDGYLDVVTANYTAKTYSVFLFDPARNTFAAPVERSTGNTVTAIATGDFNDDGIADMALSIGSGAVELRIGDGAGGFGRRYFPLIRNSGPRDILAADVNRDGRADLVVADYNLQAVTVHLNKGGAEFAPPGYFPVPARLTTALARGDFNADGNPDIVAVGIGSSDVAVLLGNGKGSFTTAPGPAPLAGKGPQGVAVADLNLDGFDDLIVTNSGADENFTSCDTTSDSISVFIGNGSGGFTASPLTAIANLPEGLVAADLDLDGKTDLAVTSTCANAVTVLMNRCSF
ncbi:MAG: FG-GAP-like repeat-containing protein [Thermoanaerobaculia bacterium]